MRPLCLAALLAACGTPDEHDSGVDASDCSLVFYADVDGDAHGDPDASVTACTAPAGHVARADDCDDTDAAIHPGAAETCNAIDDDCDDATDEDAIDAPLWYADADGDGFGDRGSFTTACAQPTSSSENGDDCDDADGAVSPIAEETCNGIDDDCDALVDAIDPGLVDGSTWYDDDDGDGYGNDATAVQACTQPNDTVAMGGDCNDAVATIGPEGAEICDGVDDDCDGLVDDDDVVVDGSVYYADADGDGYGDPDLPLTACALPGGYAYDDNDCDDTSAEVGPPLAYYEDGDGDGYSIIFSTTYMATTCTPDPSWASEGGECDDSDPDRNPGAVEICNGKDDNCDYKVDLDDPLLVMDVWYDDDDSDGYGDDSNTTLSCDPVAGSVSVGGDCNDGDPATYPAAAERCDGVDNDCSGTIDDDVVYVDWYADDDGDGYGDDAESVFDCVPPSGYVGAPGDCDDGSTAVSPAAIEDCTTDSDDDCDGLATDCTFPLEDSDFSLVGVYNDYIIGSSLDVADVDGDATADLLVGCQSCWANYGAVYVVLGPVSGELRTEDTIEIRQEAPYSQSDYGEARGGDADGDGVDDVLVGQGGNDRTSTGYMAYVFYGPITATRRPADADAELVPFDGDSLVESLVVPDFDGDAEPDVVVGSPFGDSTREGRAYVVDGSATGTVDLDADSTYVYLSTDGTDVDALGYAIADLGDVSGDGIGDIALSAKDFGDGGVVYVLEGGGTPGTYDVDTAASATLVGTADASYGWSIASTDVDDDGTADLVVGAPDATIDSVVSGSVTLHVGPFAGEIAAEDATATFFSNYDDAVVGWSVDAGGDFDGDGRPDIAIGAKPRTERGAAYLQVGPASGVIDVETLATFPGAGTEDWAGYTVAFVPDWSGDGRSELAVGSLNYDRTGKIDVVFSDGLY